MILDTDDPNVARTCLLAHREWLADRLEAHERMLEHFESLIQREEIVVQYEIGIIEVTPQLVAATRVHTNLRRIGEDIGAGFRSLMGSLAREGATPSGPPLIVYHDVIDEETDGDIEICVPVGSAITGDAAVYAREIEGGAMATTVHRGPYEGISSAYQTLMGWISEHGHEGAGPPREIYLNDPREVAPSDLLTRVEFPICSEGG